MFIGLNIYLIDKFIVITNMEILRDVIDENIFFLGHPRQATLLFMSHDMKIKISILDVIVYSLQNLLV